MPWFLNDKFAKFRDYVVSLEDVMKKYLKFLVSQRERSAVCHKSTEPVRSLNDNWSFKIVEGVPTTNQKYNELISVLADLPDYVALPLINFEPEDKTERYAWIKNLQLPYSYGIFTYHYGNYLGNLNVIWKQPVQSERNSGQDISNINFVKGNVLTVYATRAMRKDFFEKYAKTNGNQKPAILRSMYRYLTGNSFSAANEQEESVDLRVAEYLLKSDDPKLVLDLRKYNGRPQDPKLDPFWKELQQYLDEKSVVHERRQNEVSYMPFAISVRDLREQILKRMPPDAIAPSESWLRLNFYPSNPYIESAAKYTGKFKVKYCVQQRLLRVQHEDSDFAFYQYGLLKSMAVKWKDQALMQCLDDKAIIPVGDPKKPLPAVGRTHGGGLVAGNNNNLLCADHDYHTCGIVPSVCLMVDIPNDVKGSFYHGDVHITIKDKIFQPSSPLRHATETVKIIREKHSDDDVTSQQPILLRFTDGGPDHRTTYVSVQFASILEFIALDLDLFVACRTAPHQSYNNPAERVMALLNLGLQNVSLTRQEMDAGFEMQMKSLSSMRAIRNCKRNSLIDALKSSMNAPIQVVKDIFSRLKRSNGEVIVHDACSDNEMEDLKRVANLICEDFDTSKEVKKFDGIPALKDFVARHCRLRHYSFQVLYYKIIISWLLTFKVKCLFDFPSVF